ncbi:MAG: type II toxin-antitoxin system HicB family antitoxin [Deltaproteobacteria bacterium]|nr:type II toxin-antitoxin system HicB family antitoxin [Deltaproteobacteria bacterium]
MQNYIALIHKDEDSDFGVSFPDFPGCSTAGTTMDEARKFAYEALALRIQGMLQRGEAIPRPSRLEEVLDVPEFSDALAFFVVRVSLSVEKPKKKTARVCISVPQDILDKIDAYAKRRDMSRSAFLVSAAEKAMEEKSEGK